jgi:putative hydrolase of the HAD superfamily
VTPVYLILDGDDTLWENNVYFEQAIDEFIQFLAHSSMSRLQVRAVLDEIERLNSQVHGYGSLAFSRNLRQCYERLCEREIRPDDLDHVMGLGARILKEPLRLIEGVEPTLRYLADRHELTLLTKGHLEEQKLKIERSGLADHFRRTVVVKEKDRAAYRALVAERAWQPDHTWMVGNSPRSDINPALAAGLNAVHIPHALTWSLEQEDVVPANGRLLVLERFEQLRQHF